MKRKVYTSCLIALFIILLPIYAFAADEMGKLDTGGARILTIVRRIGYWIILIKGITEVVKAGLHGDKHAIGNIIMNYLLIYAALFFLPWALRLVEGIF
jgi:hypothetical protein